MCEIPVMCGRAGAAVTDATASPAISRLHGLFFTLEPPRRRDAERLHLSIEVAPLDAEDLGGPRHVALLFGERPEDQIALEPVARFVQRQPLGRRRAGFGV